MRRDKLQERCSQNKIESLSTSHYLWSKQQQQKTPQLEAQKPQNFFRDSLHSEDLLAIKTDESEIVTGLCRVRNYLHRNTYTYMEYLQ